MNRPPWLEITRIKGATIPEAAALDLLNDIDDAVRRRDPASLRNFAREAELSGMDQEAARARELADVMIKADRGELLKIKAALRPPAPTQAQLVARFDAEQLAAMGRGARFDRTEFETTERARVEEQDRQLAARLRRHEEQRRAQAERNATPKRSRVELNPLRDPIHDRAGHEAAHLAAMGWYGYSADFLRLDLRHGDFGHFGMALGVRRRDGDPERESLDRSTIAAIGPLLGGTSLDHPSSAADRRCIDLNAEPGWSVDAWRFVATERARALAHAPGFAAMWRALVVQLGDEYVELHGAEVDRFIDARVPVVA